MKNKKIKSNANSLYETLLKNGGAKIFSNESEIGNYFKMLQERSKNRKFTPEQKIVFDSFNNDTRSVYLEKLCSYIDKVLLPTLNIGKTGKKLTNRFSGESIDIKNPKFIALVDRLFELERKNFEDYDSISENDFINIRDYFRYSNDNEIKQIYRTLID